jgi:hypothetical protein
MRVRYVAAFGNHFRVGRCIWKMLMHVQMAHTTRTRHVSWGAWAFVHPDSVLVATSDMPLGIIDHVHQHSRVRQLATCSPLSRERRSFEPLVDIPQHVFPRRRRRRRIHRRQRRRRSRVIRLR